MNYIDYIESRKIHGEICVCVDCDPRNCEGELISVYELIPCSYCGGDHTWNNCLYTYVAGWRGHAYDPVEYSEHDHSRGFWEQYRESVERTKLEIINRIERDMPDEDIDYHKRQLG